MDTHIAPSPDFDHHELAATARLPGEPDPDAQLPISEGDRERLENSTIPAATKKHHPLLLGGAAVVGVIVVVGAAFVLSHNNQVGPVPVAAVSAVQQSADGAGIKLERPLAPSASLASVAAPSRPKEVVLSKYVSHSHDQDLSDILAMRPGEQAQHAQNSGSFVPHEPGSALAPPKSTVAFAAPKVAGQDEANDITRSIIAALGAKPPQLPVSIPTGSQAPLEPNAGSPQQAATATPAVEPTTLPTSSTVDAVRLALHLQAAPMAAGDQIKVLELVTQMATMVRDLKAQNANLRADFSKISADDQARIADFARRIDFAEASKAVAAASGAGDQGQLSDESRAPHATMRPAMAFMPIAVTRPEAALPSSAPQEAKHYRVQAASPGLALLTEIARGGGDGAQLQVTVGEAIPGWGRVKSVAQRGTSWVVSTEKGMID